MAYYLRHCYLIPKKNLFSLSHKSTSVIKIYHSLLFFKEALLFCSACSRKNNKLLFSTEIALAVGVWNYTFHSMRMTDAILPGHTSPSTIKCSANHARTLFSFPLCWQQFETSRHEREHSLSIPGRFQTAVGLFILREHISTFVPLLLLGDHSLSIIYPS